MRPNIHYLVIGGSASGVSCAQTIRSIDKKCKITVISDEKDVLYSRCLLTYLLAGSITEDKLRFRDEDFYRQNGIEAINGIRVAEISSRSKYVLLEDGRKIDFDKLLIATGSTPKMVDVKGIDKEGVFTVRYLRDAKKIDGMLNGVKTAVILGGGLIGMRLAYALRARGKDVAVVVKSKHILSQMLDKDAADIIQKIMESNGIRILLGRDAKEITGKDRVEGVILDDGKVEPCGIVVIGKGVSANTELAAKTSIKTHWGIVVNEYMETSEKDIYAAGDVAETIDIARDEPWINALWPCAVEQGRIAGLNMAGEKTKYKGSLSMNSVEFFGLPAVSIGITEPGSEGFEILKNTSGESYRMAALKNGRLVGAVLIGDIEGAGVYEILIEKKIDVSGIKEMLIENHFDFGKILPIIKSEADKFDAKEFKDTVTTY